MNGAANAVGAAKGDAGLNGFSDGVNSVTVTVNNPPASGSYTSDPTAVEVIVAQSVKPLFMGVLGFGSTNVRARSVARLGSSGTCFYTLDPTASGAFTASGGVNVQVNCGVMINSSSASALTASGGSLVTATGINVVGGYSSSGGAVFTPAPVTHLIASPDPLSTLTAPAVGGCGYGTQKYKVSGGVAVTLDPGVYCNGISISGGATVTLNPGTYILLGGGLSVSGGSSLTGSGVTFYNTKNAGNSYGPISFSGGTTENLSAPTTGALAGILIFQDRSVTGGGNSDLTGGTTMTLNGAVYFPTTALSFSGGTAAHYTLIVSKTVSFSGGVTVNSDYSSLPNGSPIKASASMCE
jgi:hypothetical protein